MNHVLESLDLLLESIHRDLFVLNSDSHNEFENTESNWNLLVLSLPVVTCFWGSDLQNFLGNGIKISVRIKWLDFEHDKRLSDDGLLLLLLTSLGLGSNGSGCSTIVTIITKEIVHIDIILLGSFLCWGSGGSNWSWLGRWIELFHWLFGHFNVTKSSNERWETHAFLEPLGDIAESFSETGIKDGLESNDESARNNNISNCKVISN